MASVDKLVIEITGDSSGLTKALAQVTKNLTAFNTNINSGNKAINSFVAALNKGVSSANRLAQTLNSIKSAFTGLAGNVNKTSAAMERMGNSARKANADIKSFATQLNKLASSFERISGASKSATAAINSLQRRVTALGNTVTAANKNMQGFNRVIQTATANSGRGGVVINQYGKAVNDAGSSAGRSSNLFNKLNKANITLMEGFRRHVAQITALRTLTYQAIFWFSPLVYSIIKVNAQYEKQMQLLKNLSGQSSELAKTQWANETRKQLIGLANTNPFSLEQITGSFVRMKVSGLDPLNGSLKTLMDSIAAFGGGNEELDRAGIALQQMVGKSAVSMEELRQQLGEHIPDAMSAMAKGMGLSMAEFYKQVQTGTVESKSAISKMLAVLNAEHRGAAANMMNTWSGLMARLGTAWQNFVAKLEHSDGRNTFIDTLKQKVQELMVFLNSPAGVNFAISVEQALATVVRAITGIIKVVYEWRTQIVAAAKMFAIMWGGKLVLGTIVSVGRIFATVVRTMVLLTNALIGRQAAAALVSVRFAAGMRSVAVALGIANSAAQAASMSIGMIASRMLGAVGIAIALAGAIWLVVKALNAQSNAQKNAQLAKDAAAGKTFNNDAEKNSERSRISAIGKRVKEGGYWDTDEATGNQVFIKDSKGTTARLNKEYNQGAHAFNLKLANTRNANVAMVNTEFQAAQPDPYAATRTKYNDIAAGLTDGKKLNANEQAKNVALAADAQKDIDRLIAMRKTAKGDQIGAINDLINTRIQDKQSFLAGQAAEAAPNVSISKPGKDKKKKKDGAGFDKLQKYRDRYASAYVSTADLEHQYDDLKKGTSTEFDGEAAQAEGERRASLLKTAEALKQAAAQEKSRQEEIRKSIKVEEAIRDITDKRAETEAGFTEQLGYLKTNYDSVDLASKNYREQLEREKKTELDIIEARMLSGKATTDQIRQYVALKEAINNAVRAKQAELIVEGAKDAKAANEDYYASFRSPIQQANYVGNQELNKYTELLRNANELASHAVSTDEELADAKTQLAAATKAKTEATDDATRAEQDAIIVTASKRIQDDAESRAAREAIPYLQERIRILNEEKAIREKWSGMGGPMLDWAKKAAGDFNDLGASMGNVLTGAMDDFINGLAEGKASFKDFLKSVLKGLLMIIIRGLIAKAIMSALGMGGGGSIGIDQSVASLPGSGTSGLVDGMHTGGIVGQNATFRRSVDPAMFSFAKRYHTGGVVGIGSNEVPIIAEKGEGVFTKSQMDALGRNSKGSNVQVNVINQTGVEADVHRDKAKFDGEKWVETIILKKMSQPGPIRDGLAGMRK